MFFSRLSTTVGTFGYFYTAHVQMGGQTADLLGTRSFWITTSTRSTSARHMSESADCHRVNSSQVKFSMRMWPKAKINITRLHSNTPDK